MITCLIMGVIVSCGNVTYLYPQRGGRIEPAPTYIEASPYGGVSLRELEQQIRCMEDMRNTRKKCLGW